MAESKMSIPIKGEDDIFSSSPFIGIRRHRLLTDGQGVTTLVAFHRCPLDCKYCLNPQCKDDKGIWRYLTPRQLYDRLIIDDLYFQSTGGGVVFGGGEPLLYPSFIKQMAELCKGRGWKISVESSLNVPISHVQELTNTISEYIVDIKDMNPAIYRAYTGKDNRQVIENLEYLVAQGCGEKVLVRIPAIKGYNTNEDIAQSEGDLHRLGITRIEHLKYVTNPKEQAVNADRPMGNAICEVLKHIRMLIAKTNHIDYKPHECQHKGDCLGTCPRCEYELNMLKEVLEKRKSGGYNIKI